MTLDIFHIDSFTDTLFQGNPACVVPLEQWLSDDILLKIAEENAVAETAFIIRNGDDFDLRWFTPDLEMDLCGHATLAAVHAVKTILKFGKDKICFNTQSGLLAVTVASDQYILNFPSRPPFESVLPNEIRLSLNIQPQKIYKAERDYVLVYNAEKEKPRLEIKMKEVQNKLEQAKKDYDDLATNSTANIFQKINSAFERILAAFDNAKDKNTREFLALLAKEANLYLSQLNVEDFFGVISIIEDYSGAKLKLNDSLGEEVYNPSQSQLTTMRMSVLFAISKLTTLKRENDYPLIFDAPTSSFGVIKERDFFNLISAIRKQCIIFTKNFIEISKETGKAILNKEEIDKMQGRVYRIEKRKPFDNKDLSTIQTQITPIN